jgi:DNA primase
MSVVEEIKQRVDIVDLISQHVALKRSGRGFIALCPFHTEKTPSFHVDPSRQSWHCFGACGTGGDVFSFVMKKENVEFREAMRLLAQQAGVSIDERRDPQQDARRAKLYEVNEAAAAFFHAQLTDDGRHARGADLAREYVEERRLSAGAVDSFQLGYAPNSWDTLLSHLRERGFAPDDALAAGVAVEGERGPYDRFRHRLMFPIRDDRGRVAGFGGRLLPGEALGAGEHQPKYVNTPQTAVFDKSAILYGLDRAKDAIRTESRAIIVEGYMDVIAAHEHNFANVVASMGTALTERQVAVLKRFTSNIVLALDADTAGSEATLRGVQVVADNVDHETVPVPNWRGVVRQQEALAADIRVVTMPAGRDPDDIIRGDADDWPRLVDAAQPVVEYLFDAVAARHDLADPRERSAVSSELLPIIVAMPDRVVQSHYLQRLARLVQVDEATLRLEMRRPQRRGAEESAVSSSHRGSPLRDRKEEFCLALLIRYPELRSEGVALDADLFGHSENRSLFEAWIGWADGEPFGGSLTPDLRPQLERVLSLELPPYDHDAAVNALQSAISRIEQERLRLAKRVSSAVLQDVVHGDDSVIAERAREAWEAGGVARSGDAEEADPAQAFVSDMEAGLKVHQRILEQRRGSDRAAGEVPNER